MNGELVGCWTVDAQGRHLFDYDRSWLSSAYARPISLGMPLQEGSFGGDVVSNYFENLLPDSREIKQRLQQRFRTDSTQAMDLLYELGRDCVGALQLLPEGVAVNRSGMVELNESEIETILSQTVRGGGGLSPDFRISVAGAQEKTALTYHGGKWMLPTGTMPTTHLIKLPLGQIAGLGIDMSLSIENEWLCHRILQELHFEIAPAEIQQFGSKRVLVVERFDRRWDGDRLFRLPQEDFCQVTGTSPGRKYEADGGPGMRKILELLAGSVHPQRDREQFFRAQLCFWLLGATDGHAKNFSIFILPQGRFRLTPLYDVISAYTLVGNGPGAVAMRVGGQYHWKDIQLRHWQKAAVDCGLTIDWDRWLGELGSRVPEALETVVGALPAGFPAVVRDSICEGVLSALKRLTGG